MNLKQEVIKYYEEQFNQSGDNSIENKKNAKLLTDLIEDIALNFSSDDLNDVDNSTR